MKRRSTRIFATAVAVACLLAGCSSTGADEKKDVVTIGTLPWEESLAVTAVWKQVLEDEGFEVDVKQLDPGPAYQALSTGQIDVFPDQWPNYFKDFMDKYKGKINTLGTWYEGTDINLAVPAYLTDINSISDLAANADDFGDQIVGIEAGSETMRVLKDDVVPTYGLDDFKIQTSSTPAMLASLESAIKAEKPIVVTLWRPHWAFAKYPIKALEDPNEAFGGADVIQTASNPKFTESDSKAVDILRSFALRNEELAALELAIHDADGDADAGAKVWIKANRELVDSWAQD